ncbi:ABC transporter G family member 6 [Dichanthelium oligosanthes]|uniref:ABC transporter G family member 6 n=1 Tax=Dichanthelium oligosanthes TaxID=888268 RepID=A0A1E5ULC8_9POAL|nr:ABC transporter G family member 6 [Dichanthelium oligosanthes]
MRRSRRPRMRWLGWWMDVMTMLPLSAMRRSTLTTMNAEVESSPDVGSSRNRRIGSWMMSVPMETLRRSPPDTPRCPSSPMMVLAAARRPSWSMSACTRARFLAGDSTLGRRNSAAKESVSVTVSIGKSRSSCMT